MDKINKLAFEMTRYYSGDPARIQHFIKVHSFSRLIGESEGLPKNDLFILEAASLVHDIGIKKAEELYARCDGPLQERLGPEIAKQMMTELGFEKSVISRVCYLVGHHHTYDHIDGADYRILVEADFLVNLFEDGASADAVRSAYDKIFETESGKYLCRKMFGIN